MDCISKNILKRVKSVCSRAGNNEDDKNDDVITTLLEALLLCQQKYAFIAMPPFSFQLVERFPFIQEVNWIINWIACCFRRCYKACLPLEAQLNN